MTISGFDCASYQGVVNFAAGHAAGFEFCVNKATQGVGYVNPYFARNWAACQAAGVLRGAYHYAEPDSNAPEAEADHFLSTVGPLAPGDVLALDLEEGSGNLADWALRWLQYVEQRSGCKPLLYSGLWFMQPHGLLVPSLADFGLWLAAYQATQPAAPAPWTVLAVWQRSDKGSVPGVTGAVDVDTFNGDAAALARYGVPTAAPDPRDRQILELTDTLIEMTRQRDAAYARITAGITALQG